jgi:hypothetical protein
VTGAIDGRQDKGAARHATLPLRRTAKPWVGRERHDTPELEGCQGNGVTKRGQI